MCLLALASSSMQPFVLQCGALSMLRFVYAALCLCCALSMLRFEMRREAPL